MSDNVKFYDYRLENEGGVSMVNTCKAAVITRPNEPVEIKEFPIPKVHPRAMLVHMKVSGIRGTDIHI